MQQNMQNMVLLSQSSSCNNFLPSVSGVEVGTYSSLTRPEKLCIYPMDSFTVIALSFQRGLSSLILIVSPGTGDERS